MITIDKITSMVSKTSMNSNACMADLHYSARAEGLAAHDGRNKVMHACAREQNPREPWAERNPRELKGPLQGKPRGAEGPWGREPKRQARVGWVWWGCMHPRGGVVFWEMSFLRKWIEQSFLKPFPWDPSKNKRRRTISISVKPLKQINSCATWRNNHENHRI